MKKLLLSFFVFISSALTIHAGDALYKTLTFSAETNSQGIGSYSTTWTANCEDIIWTISNFNNNNNNWRYVKCGRKNTGSTAYISTPQIDVPITKVVVTVDACTTSKVLESYLEVASDSNFTADVQKVSVEINKGDVVYAIPSFKAGMYYRLTYVCDAGSSNGLITISKVELYQYDASTVSAPIITVKGGNIYKTTPVTITASSDAEVYYIIDEGLPQQYVEPVIIDKSCTLTAYAVVGEMESERVSEQYVMADSYTSLEKLFDNSQQPTLAGVPVIVQIVDEEIKGIATTNTGFRNGVYLNYYPWTSPDMFELYCPNVPEDWKEGDLLSGVAMGLYQEYNGRIEISLISWDGFAVKSVLPAGPDITPSTGVYNSDQMITLADPTGNDYTIYYTLDGTDPDDQSILYEGPFTITETTTVKAVYYDDSDVKSGVSSVVITINKKPEYTTIAQLNENCTAKGSNEAPEITFKPSNLLVAGVNGSNVFVTDATGSFLLYGSGSNLKRGDVISGSVTGRLYSYNGLPEISVSDNWTNIKVESKDNPVTPIVVNPVDIQSANASQFVRMEGLVYKSEEKVSNKINYTLSHGNTEVVIRDQFVCLSDVFEEGKTYHINAFVVPFRETIQYYVTSVEDVTEVTQSSDIREDVNGDGAIDTQDVLSVYEEIQNNSGIKKADVNNDSVVDTQDVLTIYDFIQKH